MQRDNIDLIGAMRLVGGFNQKSNDKNKKKDQNIISFNVNTNSLSLKIDHFFYLIRC